MAEKIVKVGIVGFGTVGCGVAKLLLTHNHAIEAKTGVRLELACVVDKDTTSPRPVQLGRGVLTDDINKLLDDNSIEIGIELIGGTTAAKKIQEDMLKAGKHVVTANKALLAEHSSQLYKTAHENNKCIAFEASCAGGIPVVSGIRTGLVANDIQAMYGILNGTCNYILSRMSTDNMEFAQALAEAQEKGYAEADPTLDISGGDSAHKLAILSSIAFGYEIGSEDISLQGIESVTPDDLRFGQEMGYVLKLLAIAIKLEDGKIALRVHPSFIPRDNPLANISGSFNAVSILGHAVGEVVFYGRGAGMMPTASAVVADIIDVALGNSLNTFEHLHLKPAEQVKPLIEEFEESTSRFYIRLMAKDQPGVFSDIGRILAENEISISGALQHEGRGPDNTIPVVVTTHPTEQRKVSKAIDDLYKVESITTRPACIRIVDIPRDKD